MWKKRLLWVLGILVLAFFLRGILLWGPIYAWGRIHGVRIFISPLSTFGMRSLELRKIRIKDSDGYLFFSAERLHAVYKPSLFFRGRIVPSLSIAELHKPRLFFHHNSDGSWRPWIAFEKSMWFKGLRADLGIRQGELTLLDELRKQGRQPSFVSLKPVDGTLRFLPSQVTILLRARTGLKGNVLLQGRLTSQSYSGILKLKAEKLPLSVFGNYLLHQANVSFVSGTCGGQAELWLSSFRLPSAWAALRVRDGTLADSRIPAFRINHLSSNLWLDKTLLQVREIQGNFGGSRFTGKGIVLLRSPYRLYFSFQSPAFALSNLRRFPEFVGKASPLGTSKFDLTLSGEDSDFLWEGSLESPRFFLNSIPASHLSVHFSSLRDLFSLERAHWRSGGGGSGSVPIRGCRTGSVTIRGRAEPGEFASFLIHGNNIPISNLARVKSSNPILRNRGRTSFHLLFHRFNGEDIIAATDKFKNMSSRILFTADKGWVDDIALSLEGGSVYGNAVWLGKGNPFVSAELQGTFEKNHIHPYLFGQWKDAYLVDRLGSAHEAFPSTYGDVASDLPEVSGILNLPRFPLRFDSGPASLRTRASGLLFFRKEPGKTFSGLGFGRLTPIRGKSHLRFGVPIPQAALENAVLSLGIHHGSGGLSLVAPSFVLFGKVDPDRSRFTFAGTSGTQSPSLLSLSAAGRLLEDKRHPLFSLSALAQSRWLRKPVAIAGDFDGDSPDLRLSHLQAVWGKSLYNLDGRLSRSRKGKELHLNGSATHAEISDLTQVFPNVPFRFRKISGNLSGHFAVSGKPKLLRGNLRLFLHDGNFFGQPVSAAYIDAGIRKGILHFNPLVARSSQNYLFAWGTLGLNGMTNLTFEVPQLSLSQIPLLKPTLYDLGGQLEMRGKMSGFILSPGISARIRLMHFHANRFHVEKIQAQAAYHNHTFQISQAEFVNGSGRLTGNASFSPDRSSRMKADLAFSGFDLESLLSWHAMRSFGLIDGSVYLAGPLPRLNGKFDLHLSEQGGSGTASPDRGGSRGEAVGLIQNGIASFSALKLKIGKGEISASGKLNVRKPSGLHVEGNNLDLQFLARLLQGPSSLSGTGNFRGDLVTSLQNPEMDLDITLAHPVLGRLSASSFSGKLIYRHGKMFLSDSRAFEPHGVFKLEGYVPFRISSKRIFQAPFDLRLRLENQDLGLLTDLDPKIDGSGRVNANLKISFEQEHYFVNGQAQVQNGTLHLPGLLNRIEDLQGLLDIHENRLRFQALGSLSNPIEATGHFSISGDYSSGVLGNGEAQITANQIAIRIPYAQVHLTPDLRLSHESGTWKLSGNAALEDGDIDTELFTSNLQRRLFPKLGQVELDTTINVNDKVHFLHPRLEAQGGGFLNIAGTVSRPQFSGVISGNKGTLNFLGHDFILKRGSATFTPGHKLPYLALEGESIRRVQGSRIFLKLSGYPGDLHLDLASDPPLTQNELSLTFTQPAEQYIAGGPNQFVQQEAAHWLNTGIESEVFYPVENVLGSALNLEYFSFEFLPTGQLGLQIGKEISPHLAVTYARAVAGRLQNQTDPGSVWGMDYHLSPHILLRGTQDRLTGFGGQILSKWNF